MRKTILAVILTLVTVFSLSANGSVEHLIRKEVKVLGHTATYEVVHGTKDGHEYYGMVSTCDQHVNIYYCNYIEIAIDLYENNGLCGDKYNENQYNVDIRGGKVFRCWAVDYKQ